MLNDHDIDQRRRHHAIESDAWDAIKALHMLAILPASLRTPQVQAAIDQTVEFLFSLEHTLNGKMWVDIETKGKPSKWVTLRALTVLRDNRP